MRHEQDYDDRNYRDRHNEHRNRRPENEQNAANRWGEPDPRMGPHAEDWRRMEDEHNRYNSSRQDWKPFEQRNNRHFQDDDRRYGHQQEQPDWKRRNPDFHGYSQHTEDRWNQESEMHHQHPHHPRHASERFFREQFRRNY